MNKGVYLEAAIPVTAIPASAGWWQRRVSEAPLDPIPRLRQPQGESLRLSTAALAALAEEQARGGGAQAAGGGELARSQESPSPASGDADVDPAADPSRPAANAGAALLADEQLTPEQLQQVEALRRRDLEVRQHEQAHLAAAGSLARGGPVYSYERGPDGRQYAVAGEVRIDTAPVPGDPQATIWKMEQVRRAALAPMQPSAADRAIAQVASQQAQQARMEILAEGSGPEGEEDDSAQPLTAGSTAAPMSGQQALRMNLLSDLLAGA
ncbi:MAG: hypothetical protein EA402_02995 [Planctomycetota bacterium]|nr:MAG: hypothetical protein EA402_02995 [Planctomycetota bacterium]